MNTKIVRMCGTVIAVLTATLIVSGCAVTKQARSVEKSGFLGDYSKLKSGEKDRSLLYYENPAAVWPSYDKVLLDPVRVYTSPESGLGKVSREELQSIVNYFDASVRTALEADYKIVDKPGPGTIRIRIALTDAAGSKEISDTISNVLPPGIAISLLKEAFTGKALGVGDASVEVELLDSVSDDRLAAAVDARVGGKTFKGKFDKWDDVKKSIDYWSEKLRSRLADSQAGQK